MAFRKLRGVKAGYRRQVLVYALCKNYRTRPPEEKKLIRDNCQAAGGEYAEALFELLTTERSFSDICGSRAVSESTLIRVRRDFYNLMCDIVCRPR